jgi:hypothetical protein
MEAQPDSENFCRHHWLLGSPFEGRIEGRCKKCGENRTYPAVIDDYDHGDDDSERRLSRVALVATAAGGARPSQLED